MIKILYNIKDFISTILNKYSSEFFLLLIGVSITWIISHFYYTRSNKTRNKFYKKFSTEVRNLIEMDKRKSLSIIELNEILREKIIDDSIEGPFQYKKCPRCGSKNLIHDKDYVVDVNPGDFGEAVYDGTPYEIIECKDCGWKKTELDNLTETFED